MSNHAWRPLWVVLIIVALIFVARFFYVPSDFGTHERGFMYGYYRKSNEEDWKKVQVKYRTREYCRDCHPDKIETNQSSKHAVIQCENCHGPALNHPDNPPKLAIDKSRDLCIRCHAKLPYPSSKRGELKGIDPATHNPDMECSTCHNPHKPDLGG